MHLPQELQCKIINYLWGDPPALSKCALVCRDWADQVHRTAFSSIAFTYDDDILPYRLSQFENLLRKNGYLAQYVRSLCLGAQRLPYFYLGLWMGVDTFILRFSQFTELRALTIGGFQFESFEDISPIIDSFPLLEDLVLDRVSIHDFFKESFQLPDHPIPMSVDENRRRQPCSLKTLEIRSLEGSNAALQRESYGLARALFSAGQLSSLVSLRLLSGPGVAETWLPFFPSIAPMLRHCSISVDDVVESRCGFYQGLSTQQLCGKITRCYDALLTSRDLRSLHIDYNGRRSASHAPDPNNVEPTPEMSPFFLDALAAVLSHTMGAPFPQLETLSFHLFANLEGFVGSGAAWTALARALTADGRYPSFSRLSVQLEELWTGGWSKNHAEDDSKARAATIRPMFRAFEEAGVEVDVVVCNSSLHEF